MLISQESTSAAALVQDKEEREALAAALDAHWGSDSEVAAAESDSSHHNG